MKFLFLESFYGGSHKDVADGLVAASEHRIDLVTLPARFWKWRMRGAALYFAETVADFSAYDGLITGDLMSLSDLKALIGPALPPSLVYFHENQLTYPLAPGEDMDVHFGFTDITTALAADRLLFNSRYHFDAFFEQMPGFLKMMPEYRPFWVMERIRKKSAVLYPGVRLPAKETGGNRTVPDRTPLIVWNHRWEFDKNPEEFFSALRAVADRGIDFRLALLGENFQAVPQAFLSARNRFEDRLVCYGYEPDRARYIAWLKQGDVVVSTAIQENFGISIVEAVRCGCLPLVPNRLAYPEILPEAAHADCLYDGQTDLEEKLARMLTGFEEKEALRKSLSAAMARFSWDSVIKGYDEELAQLAAKLEFRISKSETVRRAHRPE
jgi:glycosyltransferase involved in cell wall biosynthesis